MSVKWVSVEWVYVKWLSVKGRVGQVAVGQVSATQQRVGPHNQELYPDEISQKREIWVNPGLR
jgi:hypothetical protein